MTKINLVSSDASALNDSMRLQLLGFLILLIVTLGILGAVYLITLHKIDAINDEMSSLNTQLAMYKKKIGEMDNLNKLKEDVKKKLGVITDLRKGKSAAALRFATLSESLPAQIWLTTYDEKQEKVSIKGVSLGDDPIAEFMKTLEATNYFNNINLKISEQKEINKQKVKEFEITCEIAKSGVATSTAAGNKSPK
ncbi:MAG: PilN domain-containing protein [Desulfuromonadales bacterium]|nr:PilN domain-containing protein [Desulfuromonadales bacterium]